ELSGAPRLTWTLSLARPQHSALARILAQLLVKLLVISGLPPQWQALAALWPASVLWAVVPGADPRFAVVDPNGNVLNINANGITSSTGAAVPFHRDAQGRIDTITDPDGHAMTYAYDSNGDLAGYTDRESHTTGFRYEEPRFPHYLTSIQDPLGR